jgi:hypothetical protein
MTFGGRSWPISPADFKLTQVSDTQCIGAFFEMTTGSSAPAWIVGDTFLVRTYHLSALFLLPQWLILYLFRNQKNVYSVFRFNPPSVGFATLSSTATSQNDVNGVVPSPTIGSVVAVSATSTGSKRISNAALPAQSLNVFSVVVAAVFLGVSFL